MASSKRNLLSNYTCENHFTTKQESMNDLLFALEDSPLMSIQSPGIIDVSSVSGEEFVVQPDNLPNLDGRLRVNGTK